MASGVLLQSLGNGSIWDVLGNALNNHQVFVYLRGTTTQVQVYSDAGLTTPIPGGQPLLTGASGAGPGGIPGYVAGGVSIDFVDASSGGARTQAEPLSASSAVRSSWPGLVSSPDLAASRVDVREAGAQCDGRQGFGVTTAASNVLAPYLSTITFSTSDIGKLVAVNGAATSGGPLIATVTGFSGGNLTLSANAGQSVSGGRVFIATDDTANVQALIDAMFASGGVIEMPASWMGISSPLLFGKTPSSLAVTFEGRGAGGYDSVGSSASRILNFGANEALLASVPGMYGVYWRKLGIRNLRDLGPGTFTVYRTNAYGGGAIEDLYLVGTSTQSPFTGTLTNANNQITAIPTGDNGAFGGFLTNTVDTIKVGDQLLHPSIPIGTTITAINRAAGSLTMSANATAGASGTSIWSTSPNVGNGVWTDNAANGQTSLTRVVAHRFASPYVGGAYQGSEGFRMGGQVYTTPITGNTSNGSPTVTSINTFTGWQPGATVTGTGIPAATTVLSVDRANGTATLSKPATANGTTVAISAAAAGANNGNIEASCCFANNCVVGFRLQDGALHDGCTLNACKALGGAPVLAGTSVNRAGFWFENAQQQAHTINSPHSESFYYSYWFNGCQAVTVNNPIASASGSGTPGDGSTLFRFDNSASGNAVREGTFNRGDLGTFFDATAVGNRVTGRYAAGLPALTTMLTINGPRNYYEDLANPGIPCVSASPSSSPSLTTGATTQIALAAENFKIDFPGQASFHSNVTNNTRVTIPVAGKYRLSAIGSFASNATGQRQLAIRKNGATYVGITQVGANAGGVTDVSVSPGVVVFAATDYVELIAFQDSGGALLLTLGSGMPSLVVEYVGP